MCINTAIFINSSNKTEDISNYCIKGFSIYWYECKLPIYFGTNCGSRTDVSSINAIKICSNKFGWKEETLDQLNIIKREFPDIKKLVLFLDDFVLFKGVNPDIYSFIKLAIDRDLKYLRLKPIEESIFRKLFMKLLILLRTEKEKIHVIRKSHPYFSSLQVAIWDIDYLISCVSEASNIWDFERRQSEYDHFAILNRLIFYKHIVEKGEWNYETRNFCDRYLGYFRSGTRKSRKYTLYYYSVYKLKKAIIFPIFGYGISNLRKKIYKQKRLLNEAL